MRRRESISEEPRDRRFARPLVARRYGRRDWFMRRLLAVSDIGWLAAAMVLAMALAGGARGHSWTQFLAYGLATLPAWMQAKAPIWVPTSDILPNRFRSVLVLVCLLGGLVMLLLCQVRVAANLLFRSVRIAGFAYQLAREAVGTQ